MSSIVEYSMLAPSSKILGPIAEKIGDSKDCLRVCKPHPWQNLVPTRNPIYHLERNHIRDILAAERLQQPLYLKGPTGSGKSTLIEQVAARRNLPLISTIAHDRLEWCDLIGGLGVKDGSTFFREGPLTIAVRNGFWFLLDEIDLLNPGTATALNSVLDGRGITIPETGEVIKPAPGFHFFATGNTGGDGMSEYFIGTQKMNLAFLDRFALINVGYMPETTEVALLQKMLPQANPELLKKAVSFANMVRTAFMDASNPCAKTLSTRVLASWMRFLHEVKVSLAVEGTPKDPCIYSAERTIMANADEETKTALLVMYKAVFGPIPA